MDDFLITRKKRYATNIILIDGFSGTGKTLISDILMASNKISVVQCEALLDYLPIAYEFKGIKEDASISLLINRLDEIAYNLFIGRNTNIRVGDASSVIRHPSRFDYIKSLFINPPEDSYIENASKNLHIPIWSHATSFNNNLYEKAFGERIKILYTLRDPIFSVQNHSDYTKRITGTPRDWQLNYTINGKEYPWYAKDWEDEFSKCNETEISIILLNRGYESLFSKLNKSNIISKSNYKIIFFEDLIKNTNPTLDDIFDFLNISYNKNKLKKLKKRNKLPRSSLNNVDGYWKNYTENNIYKGSEDPSSILKSIKSKVRSKYFDVLLSMIENYQVFKKLNTNF